MREFFGEISPEVVHFLFILFTIRTIEGEVHEALKGDCPLTGDFQGYFSAIWFMLAGWRGLSYYLADRAEF